MAKKTSATDGSESAKSGRALPIITDFDRYLLREGTHQQLWRVLGAHSSDAGVHFAVWAPNAQHVALVGDFNHWDAAAHPMVPVGATGVWECSVSGAGDGALYKFAIAGADGVTRQKADPMGFGSQHPPEKASVVRDIKGYGWDDAA